MGEIAKEIPTLEERYQDILAARETAWLRYQLPEGHANRIGFGEYREADRLAVLEAFRQLQRDTAPAARELVEAAKAARPFLEHYVAISSPSPLVVVGALADRLALDHLCEAITNLERVLE